MTANEERVKLQEQWQVFFDNFDVLLAPVMPTAAFPHDQKGSINQRTFVVNGEKRPYLDQLTWAGLVTVVHLPSTAVPVGFTRDGLPVGLQVIGPYMGDRTTLDFARRMADVVGGSWRRRATIRNWTGGICGGGATTTMCHRHDRRMHRGSVDNAEDRAGRRTAGEARASRRLEAELKDHAAKTLAAKTDACSSTPTSRRTIPIFTSFTRSTGTRRLSRPIVPTLNSHAIGPRPTIW